MHAHKHTLICHKTWKTKHFVARRKWQKDYYKTHVHTHTHTHTRTHGHTHTHTDTHTHTHIRHKKIGKQNILLREGNGRKIITTSMQQTHDVWKPHSSVSRIPSLRNSTILTLPVIVCVIAFLCVSNKHRYTVSICM